jgi:WS/DGAT/MGAT family acyltransferase
MRTRYERLSSTDLVFLGLEDDNLCMHIGAVSIFEGGPLINAMGGLDIARVRAFVEASLHSNRRFRQKLAFVPLLGHPVWVDDHHFDIEYHVRHSGLHHPGNEEALKQTASRIMSQPLDRSKPLWEMWFVEGLDGGRFALISKLHHVMIDGVSAAETLSAFLRFDSSTTMPRRQKWRPLPAPSPAQLLTEEVSRRAALPLGALRAGLEAVSNPAAALDAATDAMLAVGEAAAANLEIASPTPLNVPVGPHRSFEWSRFDLDAVKAVKRALKGTVNDVVLAVTAGAVRHFLEQRGLPTGDLDIRMTMPVNLRGAGERGRLGNQVGVLNMPLPVAEQDPVRRLRAVIRTTRRLKKSRQLRGVELVAELTDRTLPPLAGWLARFASRARTYNLSVTNIPGPPAPVYLLGARMTQIYPLAFLFSQQALTAGLFSYDGSLYWGLTADAEALPDLKQLVIGIETEFERLRAAAENVAAAPRRPPSQARRRKGQERPRRDSA